MIMLILIEDHNAHSQGHFNLNDMRTDIHSCAAVPLTQLITSLLIGI